MYFKEKGNKMTKIHYNKDGKTLCQKGHPCGAKLTDKKDEVTCKYCIGLLEKDGKEIIK